jgi:hypothetical protein
LNLQHLLNVTEFAGQGTHIYEFNNSINYFQKTFKNVVCNEIEGRPGRSFVRSDRNGAERLEKPEGSESRNARKAETPDKPEGSESRNARKAGKTRNTEQLGYTVRNEQSME